MVQKRIIKVIDQNTIWTPKVENIYAKDSILSLRHKSNIKTTLFYSTKQMHNNFNYKGTKYFSNLPKELIIKITDSVTLKKYIYHV